MSTLTIEAPAAVATKPPTDAELVRLSDAYQAASSDSREAFEAVEKANADIAAAKRLAADPTSKVLVTAETVAEMRAARNALSLDYNDAGRRVSESSAALSAGFVATFGANGYGLIVLGRHAYHVLYRGNFTNLPLLGVVPAEAPALIGPRLCCHQIP